jgi:hypothetical protein
MIFDTARVVVAPMSSGDMAVAYGWEHKSINVTVWDGGTDSWATHENATNGYDLGSVEDFTLVVKSDELYLGVLGDDGYYKVFERDGGTWATSTTITSMDEWATPSLSVGQTDLFIFYRDLNADHIRYRSMDFGTKTVSIEHDMADATEHDLLDGHVSLNSFYKIYGSYLGVAYVTNVDGPPYYIEFAFLEFTETSTPSNGTLLNGGACGNWVFVGRTIYQFYVPYKASTSYENLQVGFRFQDEADNYHTLWYERDNNDFTQTTTDDAISGSIHDIDEGGQWLNVTWGIMFNEPIPDTYNTTAQIRAVSLNQDDTGWISANITFSIYNIGGLTSMNSSGWAGQIGGGDFFDLYAADTRVNIAVDVESFGPTTPTHTVTGQSYWPPLNVGYLTRSGWDILMANPVLGNITLVSQIDRSSGTTPYASYKYGASLWQDQGYSMRIMSDDQTVNEGFVRIDKRFRRVITNETITWETWFMIPSNVTGSKQNRWTCDLASQGQFTTSAIQYVEWGAHGYDFGFYNSSFDWESTYTLSPYVWYNCTVVANMSANTFDLYLVDDDSATPVATKTDEAFYQEGSAALYIIYATRDGSFLYGTDVYIDHVYVYTDWDEDYGGDVKQTILFNDANHWKMDWKFGIEDPYYAEIYQDEGFIELGMDICVNGSWVLKELWCRVNVTDGIVKDRENWVLFDIQWFQGESAITDEYDDPIIDQFYGLYEGKGIDVDVPTQDSVGFYWDMWFNQANASTMVGGRLNPEWFGMSDDSWFFGVFGRDWNPMLGEKDSSFAFVQLKDGSDNVITVKEVQMVRYWVRVYRTNTETFHIKCKNTRPQFGFATGSMEGIQTPDPRPSKIPNVVNGFFGGLIGAVIASMGRTIAAALSTGGATMWTYFADIIDLLFSYFGFPNFVTNVTSILASLYNFFVAIVTEGYLVDAISIVYTVLTSTIVFFITWLTRVVTNFINIFTIVIKIINGTYTISTGLGNLWTMMNFQAWADAVPIFSIVVWIDSIDKRARKAGGGWFTFAWRDIQIVLDVMSFAIDIFMGIIDMFMNILFGLVGTIRG